MKINQKPKISLNSVHHWVLQKNLQVQPDDKQERFSMCLSMNKRMVMNLSAGSAFSYSIPRIFNQIEVLCVYYFR